MAERFKYSRLRKHIYKMPSGNPWKYLQFDSLQEFQAYLEEEEKRFTKKTKAVWDKTHLNTLAKMSHPEHANWLGGFRGSIEDLAHHKDFQRKDLMLEVEKEIRGKLDEFTQINSQDYVEQKKLAYNDRGIGVFSFDRAAMGLYRLFTNPKTQENVPLKYVRAIGTLDEQGKKVKRYYDTRPSSNMADWPELEMQVRSSMRDVYAYHEPKKVPTKAFSIYVKVGATRNVSGHDMLYTGMGACVLADYLTGMGYSVEINLVLGSIHTRSANGYFGIIKAKQYTDSLDKNLMAVLSCDPAWFRYQGFKAMMSFYNTFGSTSQDSLGYQASDSAMRHFINAINPDKSIKPFIFDSAYSLEAVTSQVTNALKGVKNEEKAALSQQQS